MSGDVVGIAVIDGRAGFALEYSAAGEVFRCRGCGVFVILAPLSRAATLRHERTCVLYTAIRKAKEFGKPVFMASRGERYDIAHTAKGETE